MSWSEIKYAVNSTVGTDDFEPLDKIIHQMYSYIPSDNILATLEDGISYEENHKTPFNIIVELPQKIKMLSGGSVKLTAIHSAYISHINYTVHSTFSVLKNGTKIFEDKLSASSATKNQNIETTIYFNADDVFSFSLQMTSTLNDTISRIVRCNISDISFKGDTVPMLFKKVN